MRTVRNIFSVPAAVKVLQLLVLAFLAVGAVSALAQPTNDNFANATVINGLVGRISGDNTNATLEAGEATTVVCTDDGIQPVNSSVWYQWTAPASGSVTFDTIGSLSSFGFGFGLDTVLAIYTGTNVDQLTLVGADDQSGGNNNSKVTFNATQGTTYYIAVDGWDVTASPFTVGSIVLNWGILGAVSGGDFRFTSANYNYSQNESLPPLDNRGLMTFVPARATITRVKGYAGMVEANYTVTNTFYTNIFTTNILIFNQMVTNTDTNLPPVVTFTNIFSTNIVIQADVQNYQANRGGFFNCRFFLPGFSAGVTNSNGTLFVTNIDNLVVSNFVCFNNNSSSNLITTFDASSNRTDTLTVQLCTNIIFTNIVASARPGLDYFPSSGVAAFTDYQMNEDISVPLFYQFADPLKPFGYVNPLVLVTMDSIQLDPSEDQTLPAPTIDPTRNIAFVTALNVDIAPGTCGLVPTTNSVFNFERATIRCSEAVAGSHIARVAVLRTGTNLNVAASCNYRVDFSNVSGGLNTFPLQAGSDYATPSDAVAFSSNVDFTTVAGTLSFPAAPANGFDLQYIDIPIIDDNIVEFNEDILLQLDTRNGTFTQGTAIGNVNTCNLTILYDDQLAFQPDGNGVWASGEQAAGAVDRSFNPDNWPTSLPPYNLHPGANGTVFAVAVQSDGKSIIGGDFTGFDTVTRYHIERMTISGQPDTTFNPGSGANGFVATLTLDGSQKIIMGGGFTAFNGAPRNFIARLNTDGTLDSSFDPGFGADATVWATALQPDGKIIIAGDFSIYNSTNRSHLARLNPDGSLDVSFDPGVGPDNSVFALALQPNGSLVIAGSFTSVDGVSRNRIARLMADGSLDTSFNPAPGADDTVYALALQNDGKVLAGGAFTTLGFTGGKGIARLNTDGGVDTTFDVGLGANDIVFSVTLQPDGKFLVGGMFNSINQTRRVGIARLYGDGSVDTSFMDTAYNQFAGLINPFHDPNVNPANFVNAIALQADGNVIIGGYFQQVGGGFTRDDIRQRSNVARLVGGATPGPGSIGLAYNSYTADTTSPQYFVTLVRTNGTLGPAGATVIAIPSPAGSGAAVSGVDYNFASATPIWGVSWSRPTWMLSDGLSGPNNNEVAITGGNFYLGFNNVFINIISNTSADTSLTLGLTQPLGTDLFFLGGNSANNASGLISVPTQEGENIPLGVALGRTVAPLTIIHNNTHSGVLSFSTPVFTVAENGAIATITVTRTGGSDNVVTVHYSTANDTAIAGTDYTAKSGTLIFNPTITNLTFQVPITDNTVAQPDRRVKLSLFTPTGGATLGLTNAFLVIVDNDFLPGHVSFDSPTYGVNENDGTAFVTVTRLGGSQGTLTALVAVTNGSAVNGINFVGLTNSLVWTNGDVAAKIISVPILDDGIVTSNLTVKLRLYNTIVNTTNSALALGGAFTNATLTITNTDSIGTVQFTAANYSINENGGQAIIPVVRVGGSAQTIAVNFSASSGTAVSPGDFTATNGVMVFGPGEVSKTFRVPIIDNGFQDGNRFIALSLNNANPTNGLGSPSSAVLTIVDDESYNEPPGDGDVTFSSTAGFNDSVFALALQADGKILAGGDFTTANTVPRQRIARLNPDGTLDSRFSSYLSTFGANDTVRAIAVQTDGRILVGGFFTNFNNVPIKRFVRLNSVGALDSSFVNGSGADNPVYTISETFVAGQRRILLGGAFTTINGVARNAIARLLDNGSVDSGFSVGAGANGTVYAIAVQADGKVIIGGDFTSYKGTALNHLARLNADGSVDGSFNTGTGPSDSVRALKVQLDGRILIGGIFTNVNGVALNHIARLNANGSVDNSFTPGVGANDNVESIALQTDTRIVLGGEFTQCNGVTRNRITRLNPDGTVDPTINFGAGADGFVASVIMQEGTLDNAGANIPDEKIIIGGGFSNYNSQPHAHIARIFGGSVAGSGSFEFSSATYQVDEISSNVVVTVRRKGGTGGPNPDGTGSVAVNFATSPGTAVPGVNYTDVNASLPFPVGEVIQTVTIPVFDDQVVTPDLTVNLTLSNPTPPAGIGNQPTATLFIINDDSTISFTAANYSIAKNVPTGAALVGIVRQGTTNGTVSVIFQTTTNGTALLGTDYLAVSNVITFGPGVVSNIVSIPIINNGLPEGNRTVAMILTNAVSLSTNGSNLLLAPPSDATLTIIDTVQAPGQVLFAATNIVVTEANSNVVVTVLRTNGSSGTISVNYATIPGTATPGLNYTTASGTLTFNNGETVKTFVVPILDNNVVQGPVNLTLSLSHPVGGATILGPTNLNMTILDNDAGVAFSSAAYVVNETNGSVTLNVLRLNVTSGTVQVSYATTNGSALATTNYQAVSGTLTFNPGETNKSINIPILHDLRATSNLTFGVNLFNPTAGAQLTFPSSASVIVLDAEAGVGFTNANFTVLKSGTNAVLTVFCSNPNVEPISVNYASADGTAIAGIDYGAVNGVLTFTNGAVTNYILVPIINNNLVEGNLNFTVTLSSPTPPGQLVSPSTATVTITDINAGLSFSSPTYSVLKSGVSATIGVVRSGFTNSTVSVNYSTADGTGTNGIDYTGVSGILVFTNGQTSLSFAVPVTDSTTVKPDKTVLLQLSNPIGTNGVLVAPSAAVLTIHDNSGSLVVPAGTALISESGPVNGVIDPGENVTLLFALRNGGGTNTANLTATLLATNGITSPSAAQNYGTLLVNGPSTSRPYSFIANGSNGQPIVATFLLTNNGTASAGSVSFTFTLGNNGAAFTNSGLISIPLQGAASPYPSTINVSGVGGSLTKATVTLNKLSHTAANDVDVLLVSPTGQKMLVMANAGGFTTLNAVTLTFDDSAATYLPQSLISSGTNKPSPYFPVAIFPAPAPAAPYNTNLATFNGSNPNGTWSLYVLDDSAGNSGMISNGWSLNLTAVNLVGSTADLVATMSASNSVIAGNNLTYTLTVTNYGPSTATGVTLTDTLPAGVSLVSSNTTQGGVSVAAGVVTWNPGTLAINTGAALTLVVNPSAVGTITNNCYVQGNEADPNTANNAASAITTVGSVKADLVLSLVDAPDPLWNGNNVTYTITVTNAGPATAPGVSVTNTLSPTVVFVSATPSGYILSGNVVTFTNLGSLAMGGQTVATIVVKTTVGGTITNTAVTTSLVTDPFKANNSASVKTVVNLLQLGVVKSGANLIISWPTNTTGYVLESATNLNPPIIWSTVTSPAPGVSGGQNVITISIGTGTKFFRLHGP